MAISNIEYNYNDGMANICKLPNTFGSKGFSNMLSYAKAQSYNTIILVPYGNYFELILCNVTGNTLYMYSYGASQGIVMSNCHSNFVWISSDGSSYADNTNRGVALYSTTAYNRTYKTLSVSDGRCIVISSTKFTKVYLNDSEVTIPMPDIIFPMSGPLAHSGQDYSFPLNMYTLTYIRGYANVWHCIELDGVDDFKTTIISGNWDSIDSKYGQLNGATVVVDTFGTNMLSKLKQVLNGDIERYTVFNEDNLQMYFSRYYSSSKGYHIRVDYLTPYTNGQVYYTTFTNWTVDYLNNLDGIYLVYYFNRHPTTAPTKEYMQALLVQNGSYSGLGDIGSWPQGSTDLANEKYYRSYMVEAIPECSIKIL